MQSHSAPLVGAHFRPPARAILSAIPAGHPLLLRPEPSNPYDPNAIAVWFDAETIRHSPDIISELEVTAPPMGADMEGIFEQRFWQVGYVAKEIAAKHQSAITDALDVPEGYPANLSFSGSGKYQVTWGL